MAGTILSAVANLIHHPDGFSSNIQSLLARLVCLHITANSRYFPPHLASAGNCPLTGWTIEVERLISLSKRLAETDRQTLLQLRRWKARRRNGLLWFGGPGLFSFVTPVNGTWQFAALTSSRIPPG